MMLVLMGNFITLLLLTYIRHNISLPLTKYGTIVLIIIIVPLTLFPSYLMSWSVKCAEYRKKCWSWVTHQKTRGHSEYHDTHILYYVLSLCIKVRLFPAEEKKAKAKERKGVTLNLC